LTDSIDLGVIEAGFDSTIRSTVWSGRPLRALATPYVRDWEGNRKSEIEDLQSQGKVVMEHELDRLSLEGKLTEEIEDQAVLRHVASCSCCPIII
jgi:hypothetical protein